MDGLVSTHRIASTIQSHRGTPTLSWGLVGSTTSATGSARPNYSPCPSFSPYSPLYSSQNSSPGSESLFSYNLYISSLCMTGSRDLTRPLHTGMGSISTSFQQKFSETSAGAEVRAPVEKSRTSTDQRSGSICKMGQTSPER